MALVADFSIPRNLRRIKKKGRGRNCRWQFIYSRGERDFANDTIAKSRFSARRSMRLRNRSVGSSESFATICDERARNERRCPILAQWWWPEDKIRHVTAVSQGDCRVDIFSVARPMKPGKKKEKRRRKGGEGNGGTGRTNLSIVTRNANREICNENGNRYVFPCNVFWSRAIIDFHCLRHLDTKKKPSLRGSLHKTFW